MYTFFVLLHFFPIENIYSFIEQVQLTSYRKKSSAEK